MGITRPFCLCGYPDGGRASVQKSKIKKQGLSWQPEWLESADSPFLNSSLPLALRRLASLSLIVKKKLEGALIAFEIKLLYGLME